MKKSIALGLACLFTGIFASSAQVSISSDGTPPDSSAMFEVKSTSKGVLFPRLNLDQVYAISNPAEGLELYCTDFKAIIVWNGSMWVKADGDPLYHLNDSAFGGKVAYVFPNGLDALIIEGSGGLSLSVDWGCKGSFLGGTDSAMGTGPANTKSIRAGCSEPEIAALQCNGPWFLPSRQELITAVMNTNNWSGDSYWTSTEYSANSAYTVSISGNSSWRPKDLPTYVRCMRSTVQNNCFPKPSLANVGPDHINIPDLSIVLQANQPDTGTGRWSIRLGDGGSFADPSDPNSTFFGLESHGYLLRWTISTSCDSVYDEVRLTFGCPVADAGPDQSDVQATSVTLQGNAPFDGTGLWSIISGTGGNITDPSDPTSIFTGIEGNTYVLQWTITSLCPVSTDNVTISFACPTANAGPDQLNLTTLTTALQGNSAIAGAGHWSILSGTDGVIEDTLNPVSGFIGSDGQSYLLQWTIDSQCPTVRDSVAISFPCPMPDAGPDQLNVPGTSTMLLGNTPWIGSGVWSIISGTGGNIVTPSDPNSTFTGVPGGNGYQLRWTVSSENCVPHVDECHITFECLPLPTTANAGPDHLNVAGVTTTLAGNTPTEGVGGWSIMSGANGIIAEPANPASLFTGTNGTSYVLAWHITNSCGSSFDYVTISFAAFSCNNTFQDIRDATVYTTVQIASQCWMKKNLSYATGSGACGGSPANCDNYGRLYDWTTASTACPTGWHLPTDAEFCTLASGLDGTVGCTNIGATGTDAGGKMKETGFTYWSSPNSGATNISGFSGRGAGSSVGNPYQRETFWTSTTWSTGKWSWELLYNDAKIYHNYYNTPLYMSVRCLKN